MMSLNIRETWSWPLCLAMTWATIERTVWASVSHAQRAWCQTTRRIRWHVNMGLYSTKLMVVDMAAISAKHGSYQELLMLIRNIRCVMCNVVLNYVCSCEANIAQLARLCQPSAYGAHLKYQTTKRKARKIGVGFFCRFDGVIFTHTVFCSPRDSGECAADSCSKSSLRLQTAVLQNTTFGGPRLFVQVDKVANAFQDTRQYQARIGDPRQKTHYRVVVDTWTMTLSILSHNSRVMYWLLSISKCLWKCRASNRKEAADFRFIHGVHICVKWIKNLLIWLLANWNVVLKNDVLAMDHTYQIYLVSCKIGLSICPERPKEESY